MVGFVTAPGHRAIVPKIHWNVNCFTQ